MDKYRALITLISSIIIAAAIIFIGFHFLKDEDQDETLTLYGNVDVRQVDLGFQVPGRVKTMPFEEGDYVKAGSLIATIDNQPYTDQAIEAEANVQSVGSTLENAVRVYERRKELVRSGSVSVEDYENSFSEVSVLKANLKERAAALGVALTKLEYTQIFAPICGSILTRIREPGAVVRAGDPVYTLSISNPIWVRAYVNEPDLGIIYPGMEAKVYTDTENGKVYSGHIGFISPIAEFTPKTVETTTLRTDLVYRIRVTVDNPDRKLKQGMPVTIKLLPGLEEKPSNECARQNQ